MIKKTPLEALPGPSSKAFNAMNIADGDVLGWARVSRGHDQILMVSSSGQAIRFDEQEVRPMGLAAGGVLGIRIRGRRRRARRRDGLPARRGRPAPGA